jgi:hypothetical protein
MRELDRLEGRMNARVARLAALHVEAERECVRVGWSRALVVVAALAAFVLALHYATVAATLWLAAGVVGLRVALTVANSALFSLPALKRIDALYPIPDDTTTDVEGA